MLRMTITKEIKVVLWILHSLKISSKILFVTSTKYECLEKRLFCMKKIKKKRKKKEKSLPLIIRNRKMTQRERKSQCPARVGQDRAYADVN